MERGVTLYLGNAILSLSRSHVSQSLNTLLCVCLMIFKQIILTEHLMCLKEHKVKI